MRQRFGILAALALAAATFLLGAPAHAQGTIQQSGPATNGDCAIFVQNGIVSSETCPGGISAILNTDANLSLSSCSGVGACTINFADIPSDTVLGNATGSTADPTAIGKTQLTSLINLFSSATSGAVPSPGSSTTTYLRADGTWNSPPGTATPGGSLNQVQINAGGSSFGAVTNTQLTADINAFTTSLSGAVPSSGGGTNNFLRADGSWTPPPGQLCTSTFEALQFNNGGTIGCAHVTDNGVILSASESLDLQQNATIWEVPNATSTGTTLNALAKLAGAPSKATVLLTSDTVGAYGIVVGNAGTSGNAQIAVSGQASCIFDGATTAGDYVTSSSTTGGDCHDAGASLPVAKTVVGIVLSTNGSTGTFGIALFGPTGENINGQVLPGGASTDVQYNLSGVFAGNGSLTYDGSGDLTAANSLNVTAVGSITVPEITLGANATYPGQGNASMWTVTSDHNGTPSFALSTAGIDRADYNHRLAASWYLAGSSILLPGGASCSSVGISMDDVALDTGFSENSAAANTLEACVHVAGVIWDYNVTNASEFTISKPTLLTASLISSGTHPTLTGSCTTSGTTGGNFAGTFLATCSSQTVIVTFTTTAPTGYSCNAHDLTTPTDSLSQTASSATSCTLTGTTASADTVSYNAIAY